MMNADTFSCGDRDVLIAYLYAEGDEQQRAVVAAHLARCQSCTDEIAGLSETRHLLTAWTPPEVALGFRLPESSAGAGSQASSGPGGRVAWWRQPLPAWAQLAAAVAIFAAGLGVGASTTPQRDVAAEVEAQRELAAAVASLQSLESRVRGIEQNAAPQRAEITRASALGDVMPRVTAQMASFERRIRGDLPTREEMALGMFQLKREEALSRQHLREEFQNSLNEVSRFLLQRQNGE
jgi:anti-sigma factor RsiW